MHPRNIFKNGVKFEELALKYDFFKPFVVQEKTNKFGVDFEDREAILALNKALLQEYYNLDVDIPRNFLIPRIPLRVNYVLWIEDLLKEFPADSEGKDTVRGLDIGTGPCAIYALLCARMNSWVMYGTDINEDSVKLAIANVKKNNLEDNVKIHTVSSESFFKEIFEVSSHTFDFCMCNPPFFSDTKDLLVRQDHLRPSWEAKSKVHEEIICTGGEVNFVWKMINESKIHPVVR
ncbi:unnamed protein product [Allacma fusca]|uniref:U6 snRNA m(6)A methyltransferase n=1 Tax=Allacma fusca TaxID=39272 RepID=A0A8J2JUB1_9HEXA|nr:unnamed protein product [Allacma fusca]